jgi:hypothetical protein
MGLGMGKAAIVEPVLSPQWDVTAPANSDSKHIDRLKLKAAFFVLHGYTPHRKQWELIHSRPERFVVECWPRQHGKSTGEAWEDIFICAEVPRRLVWLVAPNYDLCTPIFDEYERAAMDHLKYAEFRAEKISRRDLYITFSNGSRIEGKSAENPDTLQGRKLDKLTVEEAATISDERVYTQYLRPMLAVNTAPASFISTPKGFNWFFDLAQKGMDPLQPDYFFGRAPLGCSPYVSREEIEEARKTLPDRVFQQEWEAEFVSDAGAVFRGVKDCVLQGARAENPEDNHFYAAGIDLAKYEDYSVVTVVDRVRKRQVYFDRFNEVDWRRQIPIFANVCHKYNAPCLLDSTGLGDPIYEYMRELWPKTYGYTFSGAAAKEDMINNLALAIERRELSLMDVDVQTNELIGYEYQRTKTGRLTMGAPGKRHDDTVVALALAWWQASQGTGQVKVVNKGYRL